MERSRTKQYDINVSLQLDEDTLDEVTLNGSPVEIKDNAAAITVTEKGDYKLTMKHMMMPEMKQNRRSALHMERRVMYFCMY